MSRFVYEGRGVLNKKKKKKKKKGGKKKKGKKRKKGGFFFFFLFLGQGWYPHRRFRLHVDNEIRVTLRIPARLVRSSSSFYCRRQHHLEYQLCMLDTRRCKSRRVTPHDQASKAQQLPKVLAPSWAPCARLTSTARWLRRRLTLKRLIYSRGGNGKRTG